LIAIITTFDAGTTWLSENFIKHYKNCGVERFYISYHLPDSISVENSGIVEFNRFLESHGLSLFSVYRDEFDAISHRAHLDRVHQAAAGECEWIVWADSDELHEFGAALPEVISALQQRGLQALGGQFIDRISRDGAMPAPDPNLSAWRQFPIGSNLTRSVVGGWTGKIVLAHRGERLRVGNHTLLDEFGYAKYPAGLEYSVPIHHFKWTSHVIGRLETRVGARWRENFSWWTESARALAWLNSGHAESGGPVALERFDYADDIQGEGPFSGNPAYDGSLRFEFDEPRLTEP